MPASSPSDSLIALAAATVAGAINAIAGGGTLVSFPAIVALGVPPACRKRDERRRPVAGRVWKPVGIIGGYGAAWLAQRVAQARVRRAISAVGLSAFVWLLVK